MNPINENILPVNKMYLYKKKSHFLCVPFFLCFFYIFILFWICFLRHTLFYVDECLTHMHVCAPRPWWCLQSSEPALVPMEPELQITLSSSCRYWALNQGPVQEEVLLAAEPSLSLLFYYYYHYSVCFYVGVSTDVSFRFPRSYSYRWLWAVWPVR